MGTRLLNKITGLSGISLGIALTGQGSLRGSILHVQQDPLEHHELSVNMSRQFHSLLVTVDSQAPEVMNLYDVCLCCHDTDSVKAATVILDHELVYGGSLTDMTIKGPRLLKIS